MAKKWEKIRTKNFEVHLKKKIKCSIVVSPRSDFSDMGLISDFFFLPNWTAFGQVITTGLLFSSLKLTIYLGLLKKLINFKSVKYSADIAEKVR